jgi:hypothetical protein
MLSDRCTLTSELPIFAGHASALSSPHPPMKQQPLVGQGPLIIEASRSHSDTPHSVGMLWKGNHPDAETSTWQHTTLTRDTSMAMEGLEPAFPASDPRKTHDLDRAVTGIGFLVCYWAECSWSICHVLPVFSQSLQEHFAFKKALLGVRKAIKTYCTFYNSI